MKKRKLKRKLRRMRRLQYRMLEQQGTVMLAVLKLMDEAGFDDPDEDEIAVEPPPSKLKVVGDG